MKLGIIHLSDFHFRMGDFDRNEDQELAKKIFAGIRTELIGATHIFLIISGDIAYSGIADEYGYAADWLLELFTLIDDGCTATCRIICCPGNHDVDHSNKRKLRAVLVEDIRQDPELSLDYDVVQECIKEQREFFKFRNGLEGSEILVHDDPLLRIYRIRDESSIVQINAFNTAWMSSKEERPGSLVFPIEAYREQLREPDGFAVSVLHHPLTWFSTECSRNLRTELTSCSSVVLFGHEHIPDSTRLLTKMGDHVRIVDGGLLDGRLTNNRSFNLLLLDTNTCQIKHNTYRSVGDRFEHRQNSNWQDASRLTSLESGKFRLKAEQRAWLEDMGANILHPRQDKLGLRDVFVYPDLLPVKVDALKDDDQLERTTSSETLVFELERDHVLIEGEENSGKTALLRMFFLEFYQRGKIPLYIPAGKISSRKLHGFRNTIKRVFARTYEGGDFTEFDQLDPSDRVLLIDDFEFGDADVELSKELLDFTRAFASRSIVVTKDLFSLERYATSQQGNAALRDFQGFLIEDFGHVKRDELIKRWILLGRQSREWNTVGTLRERDQMRLVINTTIGKSLVPSLPLFLLVILQSIETAAQSPIGSTYGHYYQFLITRTLLKSGVKPQDLDAYSNYMSEFAFNELFLPKKRQSTAEEFLSWHQAFCSDFGVDWQADRIKSRLEQGKIFFVEASGSVCFRYQYIYYFFLSKRLAASIREEKIRDIVRHMCDRLHIVEYSNIVLFLIHHSNDKFVLDCIRGSAATLLEGQKRFSFATSTDNSLLETINRMAAPIGMQVLEVRDPDTEQKEELEQKDAYEAKQRELEKDPGDKDQREETTWALDTLAQAGVAAKTVELIGQLLRNYYGSLRISTKVSLGHDAIDLGLRALFSYFELLISEDFEILDVLIEMRREYEEENVKASARKSDKELERWSRDFAFALLRVIARSIVGKVADSLGTDQLKPTLEALVPEDASLAYKMVEVAALLDGPASIPKDKIDRIAKEVKNNPLGFHVLRDLVAQRVYRYPIDYKEKQWLVEKLSFSIVKQRTAELDKSRRLLAS